MDYGIYSKLPVAKQDAVRATERALQKRADRYGQHAALAIALIAILEAWAGWALFVAFLQDASNAVIVSFTAAVVVTGAFTAVGGMAWVFASETRRTELKYPEEAD